MRTLVLVLSVASLAGCATHGVQSNPPSEGPFAFRSSVLTAEEIGRTSASNLLQAIELRRPHYLSGRGATGDLRPRVYMDRMPFGDVADLRKIDVEEVQEVRIINSIEATMRFGTGHTAGAILITTRRGPRS